MMRTIGSVSLILLIVALWSCRDADPIEPPSDAATVEAIPSVALATIVAGRRKMNTCFTVVRLGHGRWVYAYGSVKLDASSPGGRPMRLSYIRRSPEGIVKRVANCLLSSEAMVGPALQGFRARGPATFSGSVALATMDEGECYWDGQVYVCDEIDATVCQDANRYYDAITDSCECSNGSAESDCSFPDPGNPGSGDDGGCTDPDFCGAGGGSSGGGDGDCMDCIPDMYDLGCPENVVRSSTVDCDVMTTAQPLSVAWSFTGEGQLVNGLPTENGLTWSGVAVVGGQVSARITMADNTELDLTSSFAVSDRPWSWSSSDWTYTAGGLPDQLHQLKYEGDNPAQTCPTVGCQGTWVQPEFQNGIQSGSVSFWTEPRLDICYRH